MHQIKKLSHFKNFHGYVIFSHAFLVLTVSQPQLTNMLTRLTVSQLESDSRDFSSCLVSLSPCLCNQKPPPLPGNALPLSCRFSSRTP